MPKACFPLFAPAHPEVVQQLDEFYTNDDDLTFDLDPIYDANLFSSLNMKNQNSQFSALNSILNFSANSSNANLSSSDIHTSQQQDFHGPSWTMFGQNFTNNEFGTQQEEDNNQYKNDKKSKKPTMSKKGDQGKNNQKKKYIKKGKKKEIDDAEETLTSPTAVNQQNLLQSIFGNLLPPAIGANSIDQHVPNLGGGNPLQTMPLLNFNAPQFSNTGTNPQPPNTMIMLDKNKMKDQIEDSSTTASKKRSLANVKSSGKSTMKVGRRRKSEEQMERRRERNRILARRTRLRKKFYFESLQKQVLDLKTENTHLRHLVQKTMKDKAPEVLGKCSAVSEIPAVVRESMGEGDGDLSKDGTSKLSSGNMNLIKAFQSAQQSFIVTDPSLPDNPIVFATEGFVKLTGYRLDQVLGRNCRFLQGPETDQKSVEKIAKALKDGVDTSTCLLNYKADGSTFWNHFFIAPLRDLNNNVVYYVGAQCAVEKPIDYDMVKLATTVEDADDMLMEYSSPSSSPGGRSHVTKIFDDLASDFCDLEEQDNETQIVGITKASSSDFKNKDQSVGDGKDPIDEKQETESGTDSTVEIQRTSANLKQEMNYNTILSASKVDLKEI